MITLEQFRHMPHIRNSFFSEEFIFTASDLAGGVNFEESVNTGDELSIGSCIAARIEFQVKNLSDQLEQAAGKEFVWKQAVQTGKAEFPELARAAGSGLICLRQGRAYAARGQALSVWDVETVSRLYELSTDSPVTGLIIQGDTLYCVHEESPLLTAYAIGTEGLFPAPAPSLNRFFQYKVSGPLQGKSLWVQGEFLREYQVIFQDLIPVNLVERQLEYVQMGIFRADEPVRVNETQMKISCLDRMSLFERFVDAWLNGLKYPLTLKAMLRSLCGYVGVPLLEEPFPNEDFLVQRNFSGENVTGFQVLRWIAEAGARFGRMDGQGRLRLGWYQEASFSLDRQVFASLDVADYQCAPIDKVQVRSTETDIGVVVPSDDESRTNLLAVTENPLLYAESDGELRPAAEGVYQVVREVSYRPYRVELLWEIPLLRAGMILSMETRGGERFPAYIMSRSLQGGRDSYEAVGYAVRQAQSSPVNQSLQKLRGKANELTRTIEETNSRLTDTAGNLESQITQTAREIRAEVTAGDNALQSSITQTASQIRAEVKSGDDALSSQITQTASSFEVKLNQTNTNLGKTDQAVASLKLTLSGFEAAINNAKLVFDKNGLTIKNGGFRIMNESKEVFYVGTDGLVHTIGSLTTIGEKYKTVITGGKITITNLESNRDIFSVDGSNIYAFGINASFGITCSGPITGSSLNAGYGAISGGSLNVGLGTVSCGQLNVSSGTLSANNGSFSTLSVSTLSVGGSGFMKRTAQITNQFGKLESINYWGY